jgi:hypothetical protein
MDAKQYTRSTYIMILFDNLLINIACVQDIIVSEMAYEKE